MKGNMYWPRQSKHTELPPGNFPWWVVIIMIISIAVAIVFVCTGCVGYHSELRKEQAADYNLKVACTNLAEAAKAYEAVRVVRM